MYVYNFILNEQKRQHLERIPVKGIRKNKKSFVARKKQVSALAHFNFYPPLPEYPINMSHWVCYCQQGVDKMY